MTTPELLAFIRNEQAKGVSREAIATLLRVQNWTEEDIAEAFNIVGPGPASVNAIPPSTASPESGVVFTNYQSTIKPKLHKKLIIGSIAGLIILLVGGVVVYASGAFISLDKVFSKSLQSTKNTKSASFELDVAIDSSDLKNNSDFMGFSGVSTVEVKGAYDINDPDNTKSSSYFNFKSGSFEGALDIRMLDGSIYLNLVKAPNIDIFSLKPFENKWVVVPYEGGNLAPNPLTSPLGIQSNPFYTLTDEQEKHLSDLVAKGSFIKVTKKHIPTMMDGSLVYHFDFDLDREGIIAFIKESITYMKSIDTNKDQFYGYDEPDYNGLFDAIEDFYGEAWIGVLDRLPHKIVANVSYKDQGQPENGLVKIMMTIKNGNWGDKVVVKKPADTQTFDELFSSVMGQIESEPIQ